jgi:hypothetical protein
MSIGMRPLAIICATVAMTLVTSAQAPPTLSERIGHTDPSRYRLGRSHGSEGDMACMTLVPRNAIPLLNFPPRLILVLHQKLFDIPTMKPARGANCASLTSW